MVIEEALEIRTEDGVAEGYLYRQKDASSTPGVIHLTHIRGYSGHAVEDRSMPQGAIDELNKARARWNGGYESEVFEGAHHGWTVPDSASYHSTQAEHASKKLIELFSETLKRT